ncbi:hypothetical protein ACFFX0_06300 [Citricoccus parietis]|uniref:Uncharacterized protein n=1 Tax=Citricoccus parietis TaxID=592307 RepID=A0ABV5FVX0_9MICC
MGVFAWRAAWRRSWRADEERPGALTVRPARPVLPVRSVVAASRTGAPDEPDESDRSVGSAGGAPCSSGGSVGSTEVRSWPAGGKAGGKNVVAPGSRTSVASMWCTDPMTSVASWSQDSPSSQAPSPSSSAAWGPWCSASGWCP